MTTWRSLEAFILGKASLVQRGKCPVIMLMYRQFTQVKLEKQKKEKWLSRD